jgi:hypothetical protein
MRSVILGSDIRPGSVWDGPAGDKCKNAADKAPNIKRQAPEKLQTPRVKDPPGTMSCKVGRFGFWCLVLEAWSFSGAWCLVFGAFFEL